MRDTKLFASNRAGTVSRRRALAGLSVLLLGAIVAAPQARTQEVIGEPIVYSVPGMDDVRIERDIEFKTGPTGQPMRLDLYHARGADSGPAPVVIFVNAGGLDVRRWAAYTSWGRLVAATGIAGVTYDALDESNAGDLRDVVAHVRENADQLGIDPERVAIWASSRNVSVALPFLAGADNDHVRAAVLYYGVTDPTIPLRDGISWLVARAGRDQPALNQGIDAQVAAALRDNVDLTFFNYPDGQHAFDIRDDTGESRRIIAETVDFLVSTTALPPDAAAQDASDLGVRPFAPGSLPTGDVYRGMFSPDGAEFYYFRGTGEENDYRIHVISRADDGWTASRPVELGGEHSDLYPTVSSDGETMVFASYRPFPGGEEGTPQANLWRATRADGKWRDPEPLVGVSQPDRYESHPVIEPDGRLSFRRALPDWSREEPLVASPDGAGGWTEPVTDERIDRWRDFRPDLHLWGGLVHPDGDIVLLDVSPIAADGRRGRSDLWVAERDADGWSDPQPVGAEVNTEGWDNFPAFTPDRKAIVFVRDFDRFLIAPFNRSNMDR